VPAGFVGFVLTTTAIPRFVSLENFGIGYLYIDNIEYPGGPPSSQQNPHAPVPCPPSVPVGFCFPNPPPPAWHDPPTAIGYRFTALDGRFTAIHDFPTGFGDLFEVRAGGVSLGQFGPGQQVMFPGGATEFTLTGITPPVEDTNPMAFPIKLSLDTVGGMFVMVPLSADDLDQAPPTLTCGAPTDSGMRTTSASRAQPPMRVRGWRTRAMRASRCRPASSQEPKRLPHRPRAAVCAMPRAIA